MDIIDMENDMNTSFMEELAVIKKPRNNRIVPMNAATLGNGAKPSYNDRLNAIKAILESDDETLLR